jgi:D-alanine-D-alanine ligase-like ATP-grasp enzyme
MTATSLLPEIAKGVGISFPDLVEEILRLALV